MPLSTTLSEVNNKDLNHIFDLIDLCGIGKPTNRFRRILYLASLADFKTRTVEIELEDLAELWDVDRPAVRTFINRIEDIEFDGVPLISFDYVLRHGAHPIYRIKFAEWFPLELAKDS